MLRRRAVLLLAAAFSLSGSAAPLPPVLTAEATGGAPGDQMERYLLGEIDAAWARWREGYESRTDPAAIHRHEAQLREKLVAALGGFPARTPLHPQVTGGLTRDGYRVEKIMFESLPGFHVTGALFLPDPARYPPPWPGVLVPCGHYLNAKADNDYQSMGALLALNGMAGFVFDPVDQGERIQALEPDGTWRIWGTEAHTRVSLKASALGLNLARYETWDGMRALDYLQSRPEIDPERLGCTGNSGGGTQTAYLLALDDRIRAAAPSCYITHLSAQARAALGDGEQNVYGAVAFGFDHPDYLLMRAPTPVKLLAATHDFFPVAATWETFRLAKRAYTRLGVSERIDLLENDAGHNYNRTQREAAVRWFARWLQNRTDEITEPELQLFSEDELRCSPRGQVALLPGERTIHDLLRAEADELRCSPRGQVALLPGERTIHDLLRAEADEAASRRPAAWAALDEPARRAAVRERARFRALDALPESTWTTVWSRREQNATLEALRFRPADGALWLPALWVVPDQKAAGPAVALAAQDGFATEIGAGGRIDELVRSGRSVLAVDLRGTGETRQEHEGEASEAIGRDWRDLYYAYLLGRPYVGMQTEDLFAAIREARRRSGGETVDLEAIGGVGVPALHAAFTEPAVVHHVTISRTLRAWDDVVRATSYFGQFMNLVPGALRTYDLPDLVAGLGDRAAVREPTDALGWTEQDRSATPAPADQRPSLPGLAGVLFGNPSFKYPRSRVRLADTDVRWREAEAQYGRDWSARWQGFIVPEAGEKLALGFEADHAATVRVNGVAIAPAAQGGTVVSTAVGQPLALEIDYSKPAPPPPPAEDLCTFRLLRRGPDGSWQPVPSSWLRHSREQKRQIDRLLQ